MSFDKILRASCVLALGLAAAGCAVADDESLPDEPSASAQAFGVNIATFSTLSWTAPAPLGALSGWKSLLCVNTFGPTFLLTGLAVYPENPGNADQFVGKLDGECTSYDPAGLPNASTGLVNIFTAPLFGTPARSAKLPGGTTYPTEIDLRLNQNNTYVKDFRVGWDVPNGMGGITHAPTLGAWATGYSGLVLPLQCPGQEAITGVQFQYEVSTSKIRQVEVFCREIHL